MTIVPTVLGSNLARLLAHLTRLLVLILILCKPDTQFSTSVLSFHYKNLKEEICHNK